MTSGMMQGIEGSTSSSRRILSRCCACLAAATLGTDRRFPIILQASCSPVNRSVATLTCTVPTRRNSDDLCAEPPVMRSLGVDLLWLVAKSVRVRNSALVCRVSPACHASTRDRTLQEDRTPKTSCCPRGLQSWAVSCHRPALRVFENIAHRVNVVCMTQSHSNWKIQPAQSARWQALRTSHAWVAAVGEGERQRQDSYLPDCCEPPSRPVNHND